jgi:transcription initiation factor TFIIIB Brf1 subunit/transcription initiation factor TFIIB
LNSIIFLDIGMMNEWWNESDDEECDFSHFRTQFSSKCDYCDGLIQMQNDEMVCTSCHMISRSSVDEYVEHTNQMSTVKALSTDQCKQLTREIEIMNKDCELVSVRPLPRIIIATAVNIFSDLKKCIDETRNKKRRQYIASCLYVASRIHNLLRSKKEIQLFCGLSDRNITTTISEIYVEMNKGNIEIDGLKDIRTSFTKSICAKIGIPQQHIDAVCSDVLYVTDVIAANMLISSNFDGKTLGAVYVALKVNGFDPDIKQLCSTSSVNVDTVKNVNRSVFNNLELFSIFTGRCEKIVVELESHGNNSATVDDVIAHIKKKVQVDE